jgi:hypothetical protein
MKTLRVALLSNRNLRVLHYNGPHLPIPSIKITQINGARWVLPNIPETIQNVLWTWEPDL